MAAKRQPRAGGVEDDRRVVRQPDEADVQGWATTNGAPGAHAVQGISHLTFVVRDLVRMATFLCDGLGAREVYDSGNGQFSLAPEKFFLLGGVWIAAMQGQLPTTRSYRHTAFQVPNDSLADFEKRLRSIGAEVQPGRTRVAGEGTSLYVYDFDNHLFELHTGTLGHRLQAYAAATPRSKIGAA